MDWWTLFAIVGFIALVAAFIWLREWMLKRDRKRASLDPDSVREAQEAATEAQRLRDEGDIGWGPRF